MLALKDPCNITLQEARNEFNKKFIRSNWVTKIKLKCWLYYIENLCTNDSILPFNKYSKYLNKSDYIEIIESDQINWDDVGGRDAALYQINTYFIGGV